MSRPRYVPPLVVDGRFPLALAAEQDRVAVGAEDEWSALDFVETAELARLRFGGVRLRLSGTDATLQNALAEHWGAFLDRGSSIESEPADIAVRAVERLAFVSPVAVPATARRAGRVLVKMRGLAMCLEPGRGRASALVERAFPRQDLAKLLRTSLAAFAWRQGGWLVRSAAVEVDGRALLLVGPAHAGKSTAARLSAPRPVLGDDAQLVRLGSSGAIGATVATVATAGLWGMEGSEGITRSLAARELPLAGVVLLVKAPVNRIDRVTGAGAALALLASIATLPGEREGANAALAFSETLVAAIPVWRLSFHNRDASFWALIDAALQAVGKPVDL